MIGEIALGSLLATPAATYLAAAAADSNTGFDPTTLVGTFITPVGVLIMLGTGWLITGKEARRLERALEAADAERLRLQQALIDPTVPALTRSTDALEQIAQLLQTETRIRLRRPEDEL